MVTTTRPQPTVQFMLELAGALNDAGEPVALNQARMVRIADAYDLSGARVAVLPNMVLATGGRGASTALDLTHLQLSTNRIDQTAAIAALARDAEHAAVDPDDGLRRLDEIAVTAPPLRHGRRDRRPHGAHDRARADPPADARSRARRRRSSAR